MTRQGAEILDEAEMTAALAANLASDDRALAGAIPIVSHMLGNQGQALLSDDVIARMRGTIDAIAQQLCFLTTGERGDVDVSALGVMLAESGGLINHCYALAVEGALTQQLSVEQGIDPALPALLQELIASRDTNIRQLAMALMASQARFVAGQGHGGAPLFELPIEIFNGVLDVWKVCGANQDNAYLVQKASEIRAQYVEEATRLGLLERLISAVGASAEIISEIETAGLAIFISAIAKSTGQPRDLVALSCQQQQCLRLAIALRATGRSTEANMRQLALLGANISLPLEFNGWDKDQALGVLGASALGTEAKARAVPGNG